MAGIYLHIPFCKQACSYCDFHFSTSFEKYREELIQAMMQEIVLRKNYMHTAKIESIYFGGGTPSLLMPHELKCLLHTIDENFEVSPTFELTLEANPDDINAEKLAIWKELGVNRLSIGVQSFRSQDLAWMKRAHNIDEAKTALGLASKMGFELSVDLIYGLPNFTVKDFEQNINELMVYNPEHVSAYCLTVEEKTLLHTQVKKGELKPSNNEEQSLQFDFLVEKLALSGYEQYEISNFARDGKYAVHNSNYWRGRKYLGIGPSAHSYNGVSRTWNIANNQQYIKRLQNNVSFNEEEVLSVYDRFNECLLVGLRTKWGVDKSLLDPELQKDKEFLENIALFKKDELLIEDENRYVLTQKGRLRADGIASDLFLLEDDLA